MGLEPMTSPLPRECSTTELHQPVLLLHARHRAPNALPVYLLDRPRNHVSSVRNAKNPSSNQVNS